jgi:hypothetical protein
VGDEEPTNVTASQIVRAAQKARTATTGPKPKGVAKQIVEAGKRRRGEV